MSSKVEPPYKIYPDQGRELKRNLERSPNTRENPQAG